MKDEEDDDREASTPRLSESFLFFQAAALDMAVRIEQRFASIHVQDRYEARRILTELQTLSVKFGGWPEALPEVVAEQRPVLTVRLMKLHRAAEELLSRNPTIKPSS